MKLLCPPCYEPFADSDENHFQVRIENYSELDKKATWSNKKKYAGFTWRVKASRSENKPLKLATFNYKSEESNAWFCDATVECTLVNQNEEGENHKLPTIVRQRFSRGRNGWMIPLDKNSLLERPELGFIKDYVVIVEARITVHSIPGERFRNKISYDPLSPSSNSDGILIVEGKKVYVCKQLLAIQSSFFDRMFFGRFKEATEPESVLDDVSLEEFKVLLLMVYRTGQSFTVSNVEFILYLADRFEMLSILDDAENYLLEANDIDIHTKFRLSDQFNLFLLQDQLLPQYTAEMIRQLKISEDYELLKEQTKDLLFQKYIEFTTPK